MCEEDIIPKSFIVEDKITDARSFRGRSISFFFNIIYLYMLYLITYIYTGCIVDRYIGVKKIVIYCEI